MPFHMAEKASCLVTGWRTEKQGLKEASIQVLRSTQCKCKNGKEKHLVQLVSDIFKQPEQIY